MLVQAPTVGRFLSLTTNRILVMHMRMKAIYKDNVLKPLKKLDLREGEMVEISMIPTSLAKRFQGTIKLSDRNLIEEIAECDDLV